jgi:uncharacterized protein (TIGR03000 family)
LGGIWPDLYINKDQKLPLSHTYLALEDYTMRARHLGFLILLAAAVVPARSGAGSTDFWATTTAAAQELANQLGYLQQSFATIPGPPQGRGLYKQADGVQLDLTSFQQQLAQKLPREALNETFALVDGKLNQLLDDLQGITTGAAAGRWAPRRVSAAQHDLHFAFTGGDSAPARKSDVAYRQTLLLLSRTEDLEGQVRYMFAEQESLKGWNADFKDLRRAIAALQKAQQDKAPREDISKQLLQTTQAWDKLVERYQALPEGQYPFIGQSFVQVDQVLDRLARQLGVTDRRAPLAGGVATTGAAGSPAGGQAPAEITIFVPADAEVFFDGRPTAVQGAERVFVTPPLAVGKNYSYQIRARWQDGGQVVEQTRKVNFKGGARVRVDFLASSAGQP